MQVVVEYLVIMPKLQTFCETEESFLKWLTLDTTIKVDGRALTFREQLCIALKIGSGRIKKTGERYYQVSFECPSGEEESLELFSAFLRLFKQIVNQTGKASVLTLWDDVSFVYSKPAYELIYRVENKMRKLIANFMLINIGDKWVDEASPLEIKEALGKSKRKSVADILHSLDFIDLSHLILSPYSSKQVPDILSEFASASTLDDLRNAKKLIPQSNWSRYFSRIVDCDDSYLRSRWAALYELRCQVAHNAAVSKDDYLKIVQFVNEIEPVLDEAIDKLATVSVPANELVGIADNAGFTLDELAKDFFQAVRQLELTCSSKVAEFEGQADGILEATILLASQGVLQQIDGIAISKLVSLRNEAYHSPTYGGLSPQDFRDAIDNVGQKIALVESLLKMPVTLLARTRKDSAVPREVMLVSVDPGVSDENAWLSMQQVARSTRYNHPKLGAVRMYAVHNAGADVICKSGHLSPYGDWSKADPSTPPDCWVFSREEQPPMFVRDSMFAELL